MKGLALSEKYFHRHGMPMLQERFPGHVDRIAAGLVGDGSDCFGFDDEISQDHDWGPGFCLWLQDADYEAIGRELTRAREELPERFEGYGPRMVSEWGFGRTGVFSITGFFQTFTGLDRLPETLEEWLRIPESNLAAATNGKVFHDPAGAFGRWRDALQAFYPEDVRRKKIAARCMAVAQSGQYNFQRSVQRKAVFPAQYAETKFCADAMSMAYLLNRRYMPFYKWMHRGLLDLPVLGKPLYGAVHRLMDTTRAGEKERIIQQICRMLIDELRGQGLSRLESPYLLDHGPAVQQGIADPALRERNVWVG